MGGDHTQLDWDPVPPSLGWKEKGARHGGATNLSANGMSFQKPSQTSSSKD